MLKKLIFAVAILLVLVISYNLIGHILTALKANDRLSEAVGGLNQLDIKNKELRAQLEKVKSPEYIEEQARDKLGLSKEGEIMVVIPEDKLKQVMGLGKKMEEVRLPNWLGWLKVFF